MMHSSRNAKAFVTATALVAVAGAALGQGTPRHAPFSGDSTPPMGIPLAPPPGAWLTTPWTGDSAPFDAAVRQIRADEQRGGDTEATCEHILAREREGARAEPLSLMARFRWLYAATQVDYANRAMDYRAQDAVARMDPGTFRTVARVRFAAIVMSDRFGPHPALAGLERRLVRSDPSDEWVRDHVVRDLANGRSTLPEASALADRWVKEAPKSAQAHGARAYVAQTAWFWGDRRDRTLAERIVAEYGAFLRLVGPDDPNRADVGHMIAAVRRAAGIPLAAVPPR